MNNACTDGIEDAVAAALARMSPRTDAEIQERQFREEVAPRLASLGFEERFRKPLSLSPDQLRVKTQCDSFLAGKGSIVALVGIRGTGKTSISAQIAIERVRYWLEWHSICDVSARGAVPRRMPHYHKASSLVSRYKPLHADYGSIDGEALHTSREDMGRECGLLIIDEWHECDDQKMRDRVLVDLIDRFYASLNDVLIISNQDAADFAAKTNPSILSRLNEHGRIIPCKWESFRAKKS